MLAPLVAMCFGILILCGIFVLLVDIRDDLRVMRELKEKELDIMRTP
jgi:hypothetical protein